MTKAPEALLVKGGDETVLVAEDDESLRKLTTAMLGEFGYRVIQAEDGEDAINKFRENRDHPPLNRRYRDAEKKRQGSIR